MLKRRIIPAMDIENGKVVKCVKFENPRYIGKPDILGKKYADEGADELIYLDISASLDNRSAMLDWIRNVAKEVNIPFCVVGGIRSIKDIREILCAGADKVGLNTAAVANPNLIREAADEFGSQCIVVTIDTKHNEKGWEVYTHSGKKATGIDALEWVKKVAQLGAGEIVHTSIDADGTRKGYDLEFLLEASESVNIPVIASGGAGNVEHIYDAFSTANVDGALVASIIHDNEITINEIKEYLNEKNIPVRLNKTTNCWYVDNYRKLDYLKSYKDRDENVTKREVGFVEDIIKPDKKDMIVDVCCAGGRHLIEWANRGYEKLVGMDLSPVLLNYARRETIHKNLNVNYLERDMRDFEGLNPKIITCMFSSFGFFDDDKENYQFFKNAYNALQKEGFFVFDIFLKQYFEGVKRNWSEDSEDIILKEEYYNSDKKRLIRKTIVFDKKNNYLRSERISNMREFEYYEIVEQIKNAGFEIYKEFENFKYSPFVEGKSKRLVIFAKK